MGTPEQDFGYTLALDVIAAVGARNDEKVDEAMDLLFDAGPVASYTAVCAWAEACRLAPAGHDLIPEVATSDEVAEGLRWTRRFVAAHLAGDLGERKALFEDAIVDVERLAAAMACLAMAAGLAAKAGYLAQQSAHPLQRLLRGVFGDGGFRM